MDGRVIIQKVNAGIATRPEEVADILLGRVRKPASVSQGDNEGQLLKL
jgi:hypothetical protein